MAHTFDRLDHPRSVTREVVERLRTWIAQQPNPDGARLPSERVLSAELGVSRSTIREAIQAMESQGVVVTKHGKGSFAVTGSNTNWLEPLLWQSKDRGELLLALLDARLVVESELARQAALNATDEAIEPLWRSHEERSNAVVGNRVITGVDVHQRIADLAGNPVLSYMLSSAFALYGDLQDEANAAAEPNSLARFQDEQNILHRKILIAIQSRHAEDAFALMRRHLQETRDYYRALVVPQADVAVRE